LFGLVCNLQRYGAALACESNSQEATEVQQYELECDGRLLSMIDEARTVVMPLEFANADERAVTLAQYVNPD